jgi:hypothetical protein
MRKSGFHFQILLFLGTTVDMAFVEWY